MESRGLKSKDLLTILGPVSYRRSMFQCPRCHRTRYPGDEVLGVQDTTVPGSAADDGPGRQSVDLQEGCQICALCRIEVSAKDLNG